MISIIAEILMEQIEYPKRRRNLIVISCFLILLANSLSDVSSPEEVFHVFPYNLAPTKGTLAFLIGYYAKIGQHQLITICFIATIYSFTIYLLELMKIVTGKLLSKVKIKVIPHEDKPNSIQVNFFGSKREHAEQLLKTLENLPVKSSTLIITGLQLLLTEIITFLIVGIALDLGRPVALPYLNNVLPFQIIFN